MVTPPDFYYVTKYVTSVGIIRVPAGAGVVDSGYLYYGKSPQIQVGPKDFFLDLGEARWRAAHLKEKRILSLRRQAEKLREAAAVIDFVEEKA